MKNMLPLTLLVMLTLMVNKAEAIVKIAASITDLASIASYIGGDRVTTFAIAGGKDNTHSVEVLPSYMVKVSRADLYLKVGLQLDQWADGIIDGSRNGKIKVVDCSRNIEVLEKPGGRVSAEQGDVHPGGNPHYWLDPLRAKTIAGTITDALISKDPDGESLFKENLRKFNSSVDERYSIWKRRLAPATAFPIVTYHRSWAYFVEAFGFQQAGYVEPIPGIPPTASHLKELVDLIRSKGVKILLHESFYPLDAGKFISRETGITVILADAGSAGTAASDYFDHLETLVSQIENSNR